MTLRARPLALIPQMRSTLAAIADFDQIRTSLVTVQTRLEVERMVMLATASELTGVSLAPPRLIIGLLPFFVPSVYQWRRRVYGTADFSGDVPIGCW
jgi:hypothetical protein